MQLHIRAEEDLIAELDHELAYHGGTARARNRLVLVLIREALEHRRTTREQQVYQDWYTANCVGGVGTAVVPPGEQTL
jgi:hypothetical protein